MLRDSLALCFDEMLRVPIGPPPPPTPPPAAIGDATRFLEAFDEVESMAAFTRA